MSGPRPTTPRSRPASATTSTRCSTWSSGLWLFREKIDKWGWVAIGLAAVGVAFQALALGRPPWISIDPGHQLRHLWRDPQARADRRPGRPAGRMPAAGPVRPRLGALAAAHRRRRRLRQPGAHRPGPSPTARPPSCRWPCSPGRRAACRCRPSASSSSSPRRCSSPSASGSGEALTPLRIASFAFIWAGAGGLRRGGPAPAVAPRARR